MKKILFTSYYYDFSRFLYHVFLDYQRIDEDCTAKFVCFYPSAYHYFRRQAKDSRIKITKLYVKPFLTRVKPEEREAIISQHYSFTYASINDSSDAIKCLSSKEYSRLKLFWERELEGVDIIVSSGDTRPQTTIMLSIAKEHGIKIFYFEQGPFNTTIIDRNGVNANVSYKPNFTYSSDSYEYVISDRKFNKYYSQLTIIDKIVSYIDWLYMYPPKCISNYIPLYTRLEGKLLDKIIGKVASKRKSKVKKNIDKAYLKDKFILLALQLPTDAQMICHSKLYDSIEDIVKSVSEVIPLGYRLVIREHPLLISGYSENVYRVAKVSNAIIDSSTSLSEQLANAELVIVSNSTSGLDAIIKMKKVIV
ncbi:MAG: hypothetical protein ACRCVU_17355, partial [Flavobacterium sp.]